MVGDRADLLVVGLGIPVEATIAAADEPERVTGSSTRQRLRRLRASATWDAWIGPADDRDARRASVAVLAHDYWRRRFGRDPRVLGHHPHRPGAVRGNRRRAGMALSAPSPAIGRRVRAGDDERRGAGQVGLGLVPPVDPAAAGMTARRGRAAAAGRSAVASSVTRCRTCRPTPRRRASTRSAAVASSCSRRHPAPRARRRLPPAADRAGGAGRRGAAHRLRQRREPAQRPGPGAAPRDGARGCRLAPAAGGWSG